MAQIFKKHFHTFAKLIANDTDDQPCRGEEGEKKEDGGEQKAQTNRYTHANNLVVLQMQNYHQ